MSERYDGKRPGEVSFPDRGQRQERTGQHRQDRVFPLETVEIKRFNREYDADIEQALIHTGPFADEYTRSMNAAAVTVAGDIYFRGNMFNPETEEGRQTLVHELTHIRQHGEGRTRAGSDEDELEEEAEWAAQRSCYADDPLMTIAIGGALYRFPCSRLREYTALSAQKIEQWIEQQKRSLEEDHYTLLLWACKDWIQESLW
jgi:hypothetical protein